MEEDVLDTNNAFMSIEVDENNDTLFLDSKKPVTVSIYLYS
jgi:hypothetical protein